MVYLPQAVTHRSTNRARFSRNALPTTPRHQPTSCVMMVKKLLKV